RSVRAARAYAALLASDGLLFRGILLGQPGAQKQRHTNGGYCGCEEYAPKLAGSRGWHQAPSGSFNPKDIFTQSWRTRLTSRPKQDGLRHGQVETEAYFLAAFTIWDVFEKSFRSESSCCRSHGPSSVAKRQCSQPEEISHRSERSVHYPVVTRSDHAGEKEIVGAGTAVANCAGCHVLPRNQAD